MSHHITADKPGMLHDRHGRYFPKKNANPDLPDDRPKTTNSLANCIYKDKDMLNISNLKRGAATLAVGALALTAAACGNAPDAQGPPDTPGPEVTQGTQGGEDAMTITPDPGGVSLEVGSVLAATDVEDARQSLRGMDDAERAGRLVVELPDGTFRMSTFEGLNSDDRIADEDRDAAWVLGHGIGFGDNGENIIQHRDQPLPPIGVSYIVAGHMGVSSNGAYTPTDSSLSRPAPMDANNRQSEIALVVPEGKLGGIVREDIGNKLRDAGEDPHDGDVFTILNLAGYRETNGVNPADWLGGKLGTLNFRTHEEAMDAVNLLLAEFPGVIFHDLT